jgi:cell shape-determining protein MreC
LVSMFPVLDAVEQQAGYSKQAWSWQKNPTSNMLDTFYNRLLATAAHLEDTQVLQQTQERMHQKNIPLDAVSVRVMAKMNRKMRAKSAETNPTK